MTMDHEQIREMLHPYVDGELDLLTARETEQHLRNCADCRAVEQAVRALRETVANSQPAYRVPSRLRKNVRAALRREAKTRIFSPWVVFAAGAACALIVLAAVLFQTTRVSRNNSLVNEVVANHVRSLLATHLVDVASSDQHTVKPWFDGKIDFAPDVHDFATSGFPLAGGRLDYLDGKTVVALVYQRNKHPINIFITPVSGVGDSAPVLTTRRGYNIFSWSRRDMRYWAISDLNETELRQFVSLIAQG